VLVLLGGVAGDHARRALASLVPLASSVRLHVLVGADEALEAAARSALAGSDAVIAARVPTLLPLIDAADVVVTKAGGLVVSECLARGRAMVLPFPAPGQERGNLLHALDVGAALRPRELADVGAVVTALVDEPGRLRWMGSRARLAARPDAADAVASCLLGGDVSGREGPLAGAQVSGGGPPGRVAGMNEMEVRRAA
jgi:processive 1,2-diacylglycerol beta-glucosyltransferase